MRESVHAVHFYRDSRLRRFGYRLLLRRKEVRRG